MARFTHTQLITLIFLHVVVSISSLATTQRSPLVTSPETDDDYAISAEEYEEEDEDETAATAVDTGSYPAAETAQSQPNARTQNATLSSLQFATVALSEQLAEMSLEAATIRNATWIRFGAKEFMFIMDTSRRSDLVRGDAHSTCRDLGSAASASWASRGASVGVHPPTNGRGYVAGLASVVTEEELEFVSDEIRRRVIASGQEFAHEQWWTAGRSLAGRWVWEVDGHPAVRLSALKRNDVPKRKKGSSHMGPLISYLALSYGPEKQGWRLRVVPETFHLRYICQRVLSVTNPSSSVHDEIDWPLQEHLYSVARRTRGGNDVINDIRLNFTFPDAIELDEFTQTSCINTAVVASWYDSRLAWNQRRYNITPIHLSASRIWTPDVALIDQYSGELQDMDALRGERASVTSLGHVVIKSATDMCTVSCSTDRLWNFPFDRWRCTVDIHTAASIPLEISTSLITSRFSKSTTNSKLTSCSVTRHTHRPLVCPSIITHSTTDARYSTTNTSTSKCFRLEINVIRSMPVFYILTVITPVCLCSMIAVCLLASTRCHRYSSSRPRQSVTHHENVLVNPRCQDAGCRYCYCCCCSLCNKRAVDTAATQRCRRRMMSSSTGVSSLMTTTLVLAFYLQFVCGHMKGLERATSVTQIPLIVLYILFIIVLLMTSSCLRILRASSSTERQLMQHHQEDDVDHTGNSDHITEATNLCCSGSLRYRNQPASSLCDDEHRQLAVDLSAFSGSGSSSHIDGNLAELAHTCCRPSTNYRSGKNRVSHTDQSAPISELSSSPRPLRNDIPRITTTNVDKLIGRRDDQQHLGAAFADKQQPQSAPLIPTPSSRPWPQSAENRRSRKVSFGGSNGTGTIPNTGNRIFVYSLDSGARDVDPELCRLSREHGPDADDSEKERWMTSSLKQTNDKSIIADSRKSSMSECHVTDWKTNPEKTTMADSKEIQRSTTTCCRTMTSSSLSQYAMVECFDNLIAVVAFVLFICYVIAVIVGLIGP